jgi:hypothetical protein
MTITRRWQAGLESNGSGSTSEFSVVSGCAIATTAIKTGTYALRCSGSTSYASQSITATRQLRVAFHMQSNGANPGTGILYISGAATRLVELQLNSASVLALKVAGAEVAAAVLNTPCAFTHIGVDVKINAAGWVYVYLDGVAAIAYAGNTGSTDIVNVFFGTAAAGQFTNYTYFDDLYIDDTTDEAAAAAPPDLRFAYITPNGNGNYSQCAGSDGNTTDNDYTVADAADERDTYALTAITLAAGFAVQAVIPVVFARKTDGAVDTHVALALRENGVDWTGAEQELPTSYGYLWERRTTAPDGNNWDEARVNACEAGYVGKGTF